MGRQGEREGQKESVCCDTNNARSDKNRRAKGREKEEGERKERDKRRRGGKPEARAGASATKVLLAYISRAAYAAQSISENLSRRIASDCIAADPYGLRGPYGHGLPRKWDRGYTHTMGEIQKESTGGKERERERGESMVASQTQRV